MHAHWNTDDRHRWDALADQALGGLHQAWAYGQAMQSLGVPCLRVAITHEGAPKAPWLGVAQFIVQRLPWFVRITFCQGGPLWATGTELATQRQALALMRRTLPLRQPRLALFSPPVNAMGSSAPAAGTVNTAGTMAIDTGTTGEAKGITANAAGTTAHAFDDRWRLATGRSTVWLDLTQPEAERRAAQEGRWRNRLHAAERSPLKVRVCGHQASEIDWLIQAEATQRQERRYLSLPMGFVQAYAAAQRKPSQALLTLAAEVQNERCAGMMFLVHGATATYHLGWTNDTGREHSAHNLLLWKACALLAERGVRQLDLGGVNTVANPGLARFKLGSGGRVVTGVGTYG